MPYWDSREFSRNSIEYNFDMIPMMLMASSLAVTQPSVARLVRVPLRVNFLPGREVTKIFAGIKPGFGFDEVIPSWNIDNSANGSIKVELRRTNGEWLNAGEWTGDNTWAPRQSTDKQQDEAATVYTDTFRAKELIDRVDLKITLRVKTDATDLPRLKLLTLSFANTKSTQVMTEWPESKFWGSLVDVPQRAQGNYPRGGVLCSATTTSMFLQHWARVLKRPEMDRDVPEVESNVWDPVYKGAGNWPFNTAYFGSFAGLKGCVSRFTAIADLERLTKAGIPVGCSVASSILAGGALSKTEQGHLIIVVGFGADGSVITNNPAFKDGVRRTYPRVDFERAWCHSKRTVYLMVPDGVKLPADPNRVFSFR